MAAPTFGNKTHDLWNTSLGATNRNITHNNNGDGGANNYVILAVCMANSTTISSVTYNGVSLTQVGTTRTTGFSQIFALYKLSSPATGSNTLTINFAAGMWNPVSSFVFTINGCGGFGTPVFDDVAASPNTTTISVSNNSIVFAQALAGSGTSLDITIDGSSRTLEFTDNISNYAFAAFSNTLTAGTKNISVSSTASTGGHYVEIKEASGGGGGSSSAGAYMFFLE